MSSSWWSIHHHSRYSRLDGMGVVEDHVRQAKQLGYPALALTDHGTMAGVAELYKACQAAEIKALPGIEAYAGYGPKTRKTFHLGLVATTQTGYLNLVQINNQMMQDFYYKPLLDLTKIDQLDTTDVVLTTGCFFGAAMSASRADPEAVLNVISTLAEYFDTYIEAQCHGIEEGDHSDVEDQLKALEWSKMLGLPMVLGQDCHYIYPQQRPLHDTMKRLGSWSDEPDSATFPGEYGYHMVDEATARKMFEPAVWKAGMAGMKKVLDKTDVVIPPLDKFKPIIIRTKDEDERIHDLVYNSARFPNTQPEFGTYQTRASDELDVIDEFGFTGYILLVYDIVEHLQEQGIAYNIRGSAVGSLVCYLLGITSVDPVEWGLGFDRFLSRNRAKLPDVDIDVDSSKRDEVIEHLRSTYVVTSICNYGELGVVESDGVYKGSALQKWKTAQKKMGKSEVVDQHVFDDLRLMCSDGAVINVRGTHASGLVVAPDMDSMKWMPLAVIGSAKDSNDRFITAFDGDSTELMGYIKVDILGLKALNAVDLALKMIRPRITLADIPLDDAGVYAMLTAGMTEGAFQLEGWTAKNGMMKMRPQQITDIIAAMALFRPAAMDSGATLRFISRMHKDRKSEEPIDWGYGYHQDIAGVIAGTYGEIIYQEQLIDVLKALGFTPLELGGALRAVKASNSKVESAQRTVKELLKRVDALAVERDWKAKDIEWLRAAFDAYANYGFNLSHATSYGILAYQTAWLIFHHPGEFWQGMITAHAGDDEKVANYTRMLSQRRFLKMPVDVNTSGASIKVDVVKKRIYPALTSLKGIGDAVATQISTNSPYEDVADFARKLSHTRVSGIKHLGEGVPPDECPGVVGLLAREGALRSLI